MTNQQDPERGQAYTIEAVIATIIIVTTVLFIAPSFATPASNAAIEQQQLGNEAENQLTAVVNEHSRTGAIKAAILNYDIANGSWTNAGVTVENESDHYESVATFLLRNGGTNDRLTDFGQDLLRVASADDTVVEVYIGFGSEAGTSPTDKTDRGRAPFISNPNATIEDTIATTTTTVTLYDQDIPGRPPRAYAYDDATIPPNYNPADDDTARTLAEIYDDWATAPPNSFENRYAINPSPTQDVTVYDTPQAGVYNTITITFMVKQLRNP